MISVRKNHFQVSRFSEVLYPAILCTCADLSALVLQEHGQEFGTVRGQPVPLMKTEVMIIVISYMRCLIGQ